ncbi:MAG: hypothetical protein M1592_02850 [Candidatus Thermoplasmatota archaeon]|nr:hypothetical protein [Candidatus Thermoplasmatota archaeon]
MVETSVDFISETKNSDYSVDHGNQYSSGSLSAAYVYFPIKTKTIGKFDLGKPVEIEFSIERDLEVSKAEVNEVEVYCAECKELNIINCGSSIAEAFMGLEEELEINMDLYGVQKNEDSLEVKELSERLKKIKIR